CTVTSLADKKARQIIGRAKRENPGSILLVTGCFTQLNSDFLKTAVKVDMIVRNDEKLKIPEMVMARFSCSPTRETKLSPSVLPYHSRAFIKVQDGCEQNCSYCIVPSVRGGYRSMECEKIIEGINSYVKRGYEEAVIAGIHVGRYGIDFLGHGNGSEKVCSLASLLRSITEKTEMRRLRLSSVEINEVDDELIEIMKQPQGRIARHLHIPLQSGSDRILRAMNRNYGASYFMEKALAIKNKIPQVTLTTDIIVGFPGETDSDFNLTLELMEKLKFSKVHVFKYSRRNGTAAAGIQHQVSENTKTMRSIAARNKGKAIRKEFMGLNIGRVLEVVCEEFKKQDKEPGIAGGISENYIKVYFNMKEEDFAEKRGRIIGVKAREEYMDGLRGFAQIL
ncbi:MAG: MiaB/RimO family radical SAM methylthiotransferase, partial [Actinobacteria bacterium]|nr:MiaB/RimO family radical SAM methylthiotransferase [Actinomycetota bacterium]